MIDALEKNVWKNNGKVENLYMSLITKTNESFNIQYILQAILLLYLITKIAFYVIIDDMSEYLQYQQNEDP